MKEKESRDIDEYFKSAQHERRAVCVPAYERIKQLYAYGFSNDQILSQISEEFGDVSTHVLTVQTINNMISNNIEEFNKTRMEIGKKCGEELQNQAANLYAITHAAETGLVKIYADKIRKAAAQLDELDLDERDDEGNYIHTQRIFVLVELIDKLQSKIAKIAGTDALREIEITKQKYKLKLMYSQPGSSLLPSDPLEVETSEARPLKTNFL